MTEKVAFLEHVGVVPFWGFVDNVTVQNYSPTTGTVLGVYYDKTRKCFLAKISEQGVLTGSGTARYFLSYGVGDYEPAIWGNIADSFRPWPLRVYKNLQDGMSYMWSEYDNDIVPLDDDRKVVAHSSSESNASITPNVLHRWGDVTDLDVQLSGESPDEKNEYMIEFSCGETPATVSFPSSVKWIEDLETEPNTIYQISIENNLAVWAGWPK